jgi:small subunit ribosomal protein S11
MAEQPKSPTSTDRTAIAHIKATHNNTLVSITDTRGDALCWASAGSCGYKGARRASPVAGHCAGQRAGERAYALGVRTVTLRVTGDGPGLEGVLEGLRGAGLGITETPG